MNPATEVKTNPNAASESGSVNGGSTAVAALAKPTTTIPIDGIDTCESRRHCKCVDPLREAKLLQVVGWRLSRYQLSSYAPSPLELKMRRSGLSVHCV